MKKMNCITIAAVFFLLWAGVSGTHQGNAEEATAAFPGAEGFGAVSKGGRGGRVIKVTNLNAKGPGSLQAACEAQGPRIVVFDVSGVIPAPSGRGYGNALIIKHGSITIAGQTAPGAGITIEGALNCSGSRDARMKDVIIRFLRFRPKRGVSYPFGGDSAHLGMVDRAILDHLSVAWSADECCGFTMTSDFTVQWCAIEESDLLTFEGRNLHNFGMLLGYMAAKITLHHNLWTHHSQRMPAATALKPPGLIDFRNNVCYNGRLAVVGVPRGNVVGNYLVDGPGADIGCTTQKPTWRRGLAGIHSKGRNFVDGNFITWRGGYTAWRPDGYPLTRLKGPMEAAPVTTHTAEKGYKLVLGHAGCIPRDPLGRRTVHEVHTRTGKWGREDPAEGLMGGLTPGKAPADADGDGMPDEWEKKHKLDSNDPSDANRIVPAGVSDKDRHKGYTYIEFFINGCADRLIADTLAHPDREQVYSGKAAESPPPPEFKKPAQGEMEKLTSRVKEGGKGGYKAAVELGRFGPNAASAIPDLIKALESDDRYLPRGASSALAKIGKVAVPDLIKALKHEKNKVRAYAAKALGIIKPVPQEAVGPMLKLITVDKDHSTLGAVQQAVISLYRMRPLGREHLEGLIGAIESENQFARGFSASNLGELGPVAAQAAPKLLPLLSDQGVNTRWTTAWALGEIGVASKEVIAALVAAFGDSDIRPRIHACIALSKLCKEAHPDIIKALGHESSNVRWCAAETLARIGPGSKGAVGALVRQLKDSEARVRKMAANALGRIGPKAEDAVSVLITTLSDSDWHVRWSAVKALGNIAPDSADVRTALEKASKDSRSEVSDAAISVLGNT